MILIPDSMRGKTGKCPRCGSRIRIPEATVPAEPDPDETADSLATRNSPGSITSDATKTGRLPAEFVTGVQTLTSRARLAVWALRFIMLVLAGRIFLFWRFYESRRPSDLVRTSESATLVLGLVMLMVTGIFHLRWKYRANANLSLVCKRPLKYSPLGSCVYYFVPLLNFVFPMRALHEIQSRSKANVGYMVYVWWTLVIGSTLLERAFYLQPGSSVLVGRDWIVLMVVASLRLIAGFFLIKIIKSVTEKQRRYCLAMDDVVG